LLHKGAKIPDKPALLAVCKGIAEFASAVGACLWALFSVSPGNYQLALRREPKIAAFIRKDTGKAR
jgi:hypothetical protein